MGAKTSTLVAMIQQLLAADPAARVLVLAFNVDAVAQLRARIPSPSVDVHTLHSYGMRLQITASLDPLSVDPDKVLHKWQRLRNTGSLSGVAAMAEWRRVHAHVDRIRHSGRVPVWCERPLSLDDAVMEAMMADGATIDQDDQIYQCLVQQLTLEPAAIYDLILVDEAQAGFGTPFPICTGNRYPSRKCINSKNQHRPIWKKCPILGAGPQRRQSAVPVPRGGAAHDADGGVCGGRSHPGYLRL